MRIKQRRFFYLAVLVCSISINAFGKSVRIINRQDTTLKNEPPQARVRLMDKNREDIAWENDRIAFRIYGPALEKREPTGSGIDVWVKSVPYPVIEKWYKGGDYDNNKGEGLDFYGVGHSRGCGGLGVWDGQTLFTSGHWQSYQIEANDGDETVFTVNYAPWNLPNGHQIAERRTFTLEKGTNFNTLQSDFTTDLDEFTIGIGIAKIKGGEIYLDKKNGIMAFWPPENIKNGKVGCGIIVTPKDIIAFTEDKLNYLLLVKVKRDKPLIYYSGACWSKTPGFISFDDWKKVLESKAAKHR